MAGKGRGNVQNTVFGKSMAECSEGAYAVVGASEPPSEDKAGIKLANSSESSMLYSMEWFTELDKFEPVHGKIVHFEIDGSSLLRAFEL